MKGEQKRERAKGERGEQKQKTKGGQLRWRAWGFWTTEENSKKKDTTEEKKTREFDGCKLKGKTRKRKRKQKTERRRVARLKLWSEG